MKRLIVNTRFGKLGLTDYPMPIEKLAKDPS